MLRRHRVTTEAAETGALSPQKRELSPHVVTGKANRTKDLGALSPLSPHFGEYKQPCDRACASARAHVNLMYENCGYSGDSGDTQIDSDQVSRLRVSLCHHMVSYVVTHVVTGGNAR
jgi:hypothetical protein